MYVFISPSVRVIIPKVYSRDVLILGGRSRCLYCAVARASAWVERGMMDYYTVSRSTRRYTKCLARCARVAQ